MWAKTALIQILMLSNNCLQHFLQEKCIDPFDMTLKNVKINIYRLKIMEIKRIQNAIRLLFYWQFNVIHCSQQSICFLLAHWGIAKVIGNFTSLPVGKSENLLTILFTEIYSNRW